MKVSDILREIRRRKGISQPELGRLIGVSKGRVSQIENGDGLPRPDVAERIADLARQVGINPRSADEIVDMSLMILDGPAVKRDVPLLQWGQLQALRPTAGAQHGQDHNRKHKAGTDLPTIWDGEAVGVYVSGDMPEDAIGATVSDDSMAPELGRGDVVIFAKSILPRPEGDLVVAWVDDAAVLRYYRGRGQDRNGRDVFDLVAANPEYETITGNSKKAVEILGTVVERHIKRR